MTNLPDLATIVAGAAARRGLHLRADLSEPGWTFWELRNFNMHRVVGLLHEHRAVQNVLDLEAEIRSAVSRNFKRSWWRGLAFGVVVGVAPMQWVPDDLKLLVDSYENRKGVLQWVVLVALDRRSAIAVHTWEEVFLSPVYRETVAALTAGGCQVATAVKGKDGLLKFLTGVSELEGVDFPEFQDGA